MDVFQYILILIICVDSCRSLQLYAQSETRADIYADGSLIRTSIMRTSTLTVPDNVRLLAARITLWSSGSARPTIAIRMTNGYVTGSHWKCSIYKFPLQLPDHWNELDFDDSGWAAATTYGKPSGSLPEERISASNYRDANGDVYCRGWLITEQCQKSDCSDTHHTCIPQPGIIGYRCECEEGWELSSQQNCVDIDECERGIDKCEHACKDTSGSYVCECRQGYEPVDDIHCVDINECESSRTNDCQHQCNNTMGSYKCSCRAGYKLRSDGERCDYVRCQDNPSNICLKSGMSCVDGYESYHCESHIFTPIIGWVLIAVASTLFVGLIILLILYIRLRKKL